MEEIEDSGRASFDLGLIPEKDLIAKACKIATFLGTPVATRKGGGNLDVLFPTSSDNAEKPSLSREYGLGEIPLHTDTAYWAQPCRYILLACVKSGNCQVGTTYFDGNDLFAIAEQHNELRDGLFKVLSGSGSFVASILSPDGHTVRFDAACMHPLNKDAVQATRMIHDLNDDVGVKKVEWKAGQIKIFDNRRILHGRESVQGIDTNRKLIRISIL